MLPIIQATPHGREIPHSAGAQTAAAGWLAHLHAGRLTAGTGPLTTLEIAANKARTESIVRAHAAAARAALAEDC